jgi:3-hydroxybutyryl-CoA dehydratase
MPGEGSIYLKQDMKFVKPVYIGDTVTAVVSITDINYEKQLVTLNTTCINQDGAVVIEGSALVKKNGYVDRNHNVVKWPTKIMITRYSLR